MLRSRWEVMEGIRQVNCPEGDSKRVYARAVADEFLGTFQGDISSKTTVGAPAAAYVLLDMDEQDRTVVAPDDIRHAAEMFATESPGHSLPEIYDDAKTWLSYLGLILVATEYSPEWEGRETIWIAPVSPDLDDVIRYFDDPAALSLPQVETLIKDAFTDPDQVDPDVFAGGVRDLSENVKEWDAYVGRVKEALDGNWAPIANTDEFVWVNPARIHTRFQREGEILNYDEMTATISDAVKRSPYINPEVLPSVIDDENIGPVVNVLQDEYGWSRLGTSSGITWYSDREAFEKDYKEHAVTAQKIYDKGTKASFEELQEARTFFRHNQDVILEMEETTRYDIQKVAEHLSIRISARGQEHRLNASEPGDTLTSSMEARTPTAYHVAKEFEQRLENLRKEEEEEDDEEKGLSGYRY